MSFGPNDSGLLEFRTEDEAKSYLEELGLKFKYGCRREGNAVQCHSLGRWLESVKREFAEAEDVFRQNCFTRKFPESCSKYAYYKLFGAEGVKRNNQQAFEALKFGCHDAGDASCCQAAGELLLDGVVTEDDKGNNNNTVKSLAFESAAEYFTRGCDKNCSLSCYFLGGIFSKRADFQREADVVSGSRSVGQPRSVAELELRRSAVTAWVKACQLGGGGHELACRNASRAFRLGDGVDKDETLAKEFMQKATNPPPLSSQ